AETARTSSVESRYDVLAVSANDKALSKKINSWFLPYIPDINLSLSCDITDITNWNLGISFSADIFSGGQNLLEAERRKITNLTYSEYVKNINDKIKNYELQIKTKENSIKTIKSDLEELQNQLKNQEKLLKIGYISNQDLENQKIKISSKTLELKKSEKELNILWLDYIFEKGFYY
ncbi:MAG TPA: TolC family protein, partial [Tepiditoga sp.]|nr:TolC family protein [Tepiditoga sp.]